MQTLRREGGGVQIFFFRPFGASVWFKNKGGGGEERAPTLDQPLQKA